MVLAQRDCKPKRKKLTYSTPDISKLRRETTYVHVHYGAYCLTVYRSQVLTRVGKKYENDKKIKKDSNSQRRLFLCEPENRSVLQITPGSLFDFLSLQWFR